MFVVRLVNECVFVVRLVNLRRVFVVISLGQ